MKVKRGLPPLQPVELTEEPLPPTAIHNSHSADDLLAGGPPREAASDHAPSDHTPSDHQHKREWRNEGLFTWSKVTRVGKH